jgi:hypothetical protein
MDKLEQYLDQVCRNIGGPRALRRHVRQELREHLLDAAAQHQQAGLAPADALDRAIAEFGGADDMRLELEEAHGHRILGMIIDKTLEWKEKTMKAKWLWTTWATLAVALVIALAVLFIAFTELLIVPKFNQLVRDGLIDRAIFGEQGVSWMLSWLGGLHGFFEYTTVWVLLAAALWGLFEWRVRSENKTFMRLSVLGTAAAGLVAVVWLLSATLLVSFCLAAPAGGRLARAYAEGQMGEFAAAIDGLTKSAASKDWPAAEGHAHRGIQAVDRLTAEAPALPSMARRSDPTVAEQLTADIERARTFLVLAQQAARQKDDAKANEAIAALNKVSQAIRGRIE